MRHSSPTERARELRRIVYSRGDESSHIADLKLRLKRFGYVVDDDCDCPTGHFCAHTELGVLLFQRFFGIEPSGVIDVETLKLMSRKRCACPDLPAELVRAQDLSSAGDPATDPFTISLNSQPWPRYD